MKTIHNCGPANFYCWWGTDYTGRETQRAAHFAAGSPYSALMNSASLYLDSFLQVLHRNGCACVAACSQLSAAPGHPRMERRYLHACIVPNAITTQCNRALCKGGCSLHPFVPICGAAKCYVVIAPTDIVTPQQL